MAAKKTTATLSEQLTKIDALLAKTRPITSKAMKPGASKGALDKLAKTVGVGKLPGDVETFFRWHDGQSKPASLREGDNRTPMSVDDAIDAWTYELDGAFAHLQAYFDRETPPPDDWWKATDWDVAHACKEEAFGDEPVDLHEGTIRVQRG